METHHRIADDIVAKHRGFQVHAPGRAFPMAIDTQSHTSSSDSTFQSDRAAAEVLDSLGVAVLVIDRNETIRYRNATAAAWLPDGSDLQAAFIGARFLEFFDGWPMVLPRVFDAGETLRFQCALRLSDASSPVLVRLRCTPLREQGSPQITGVVILIEQEAKQQTVEERLEVSKRLASLGKLATRVAHELNNPLDGILRYINLAMRVVDDTPDSKLKSYLSESRTGLMRMVQIIGELLEFSRTTHGEFDEMTINEVVEQAIKSSASAADASGVVVAADFQSQDMPSARGSRIYQVCCNLIKNAIDAMPDGGRLSITTGLVDDDVVIQVADTGVGLPEPVERVFEPFFTTKEPGKGTGLGLAICKDFIEDMQGTITAAPGADGGAVFTVRIPVGACHRPSPLMQR
ncbi:MAG: ATP-binding protein [Phycisphaerae bacterium]